MRAGLGPDDPDTLDCMNNLGLAYQDAGRSEESVALLEQTLALRKAKLGPDDPATLVTMNNLAGGKLDLGRSRSGRAALRADAGPAQGEARPGPSAHPQLDG